MVVFGTAQLFELAESTQGTSVTWILLWQGFVVVNLLLAVQANREKPNRENSRLVFTYIGWTLVGLSWFAVMLVKGTLSWNQYDTFNISLAIVCTAATFVQARRKGWHMGAMPTIRAMLGDPWVRACLALAYKSVPQITMAVQLFVGVPGRSNSVDRTRYSASPFRSSISGNSEGGIQQESRGDSYFRRRQRALMACFHTRLALHVGKGETSFSREFNSSLFKFP